MSRKNKSKFSKVTEKRWQQEYSDGEDLQIDKFELPPSPEVEQEEEQQQQQQQEQQLQVQDKENKSNSDELEVEDEQQVEESQGKQKIAWLDSDIDQNDFGSNDDDEEENLIEAINQDDCLVFVEKIPFKTKDNELEVFFSNFGAIKNIDIPRNEGSIFNKGRAFVEFYSPEVAKRLVQNQCKYEDTLLTISFLKKDNKQVSRSRSRSNSR